MKDRGKVARKLSQTWLIGYWYPVTEIGNFILGKKESL